MKKTKIIFEAMILTMLLVSIIPTSVFAMGTTKTGLTPSNTDVTIGDTFYVVVWLDGDSDEPADGIKLEELNWTIGKANITSVVNPPTSDFDWLFDAGTIHNDTGWLEDAESIDDSQSSNNFSAFNITFVSMEVGACNVTQNWTKVFNGGPEVSALTTYNTTVYIHPASPSTDISTAEKGLTYINISWTQALPNGADRFVLYNESGSNELQNSSATYYNHTVASGQTENYVLYSYNSTEGLYSLSTQTHTETSDTPNNAPELSSPSPADSTKFAYKTTQTVQITVNDAEGDSLTGWINCSGDTQSFSGGNGTYSNSLSGLSDGTYTWYVNVTDGNSWTRDSYTFTINDPPGGGGGGGGWEPDPANEAPSVEVNSALSVDVYDADGDYVRVRFYWGDDTLIGFDDEADGDGIVSVNPAGDLDYNTEYSWYVIANDSLDSTTSETWTFNTSSLGVDIQAEWTAVPGNNTIHKWINVTNTGTQNLTDVEIWDRPGDGLDDFPFSYNHAGDFGANGHYQWTIPFLNYTGENHWYNISVWFNLSGTIDNDVSLWNLINVSHLGVTDSVNLTGLSYSFTVTKEANVTFVNETQTEIRWNVTIVNTGDFTLNNVYVNESAYPDCVNYTSSNIPPSDPGTDTVFGLGNINPGATEVLMVNVSVTSGCPENGTRIYNNATVNTSELTTAIQLSEYVPYGGYTERVRFVYNIVVSDVQEVGFTIQVILGVLMVVGAILLIVGMLFKSGYLGGGEGQ